jgi:hypothetical protein
MQVHSPIRLTCGSFRVTASELIVAPESRRDEFECFAQDDIFIFLAGSWWPKAA